MGWYIVIKTIKGRQYRYRQRTWREGQRVRTESHSLGPVSPADRSRGEGRVPAEPAEPATSTLAALTTRVVTQLRDQRFASAEWAKPFSPWTQAGRIERIAALDAAVAASGARLVANDKRGAYYRLTRGFDYINLPPQRCFSSAGGLDRQYQYYQTLFHELAHWTIHPERTGRHSRAGWIGNSQAYAREELVAEAASIVVMTRLGHPPPDWGQHVRYFRGWLNRAGNAGDALLYAMNEAELAADYILSRINTTKAGVV